MTFSRDEITHLPKVLSAPRFATYLAEKNGDKEKALALYQWNLETSAAFLVPLQICEVSVRNSIVTAIETVYGSNWPFEKGFEITLRDPKKAYSQRKNLTALRYLGTSGKIVAELKFVFWQKMLTFSHDADLWNTHFRQFFPTRTPTRQSKNCALPATTTLRKYVA